MRNYKTVRMYLKNNILPKYTQNDSAHDIKHIEYVSKRAIKFASKMKCDLCIICVAAYYHDIGHHLDAKRHEEVSAHIFWQDENIAKWFNENERIIIKEAIQDHRASHDKYPRSVYGEILSSADRSTSVRVAIKRSVLYYINHNELANKSEIQTKVTNYIIKKYGDNGYSKIFVKDKRYYSYIKKIQFIIKHPVILKNLILHYINKLWVR